MSWLADPAWDELMPQSDVDDAWARWQERLDRDDRHREYGPTNERPRMAPEALEPTEENAP